MQDTAARRLITGTLRGATALAPRRDDHHAALRVGLGVTVPLLTLLAIGRPDLSIYAVFGALTGMYGRGEKRTARLRHQSAAGALLLIGLSVGVLLSAGHAPWWLLVPVEAVFACVASLAADGAALKPEGPFYALFAMGACAMVPLAVAPWAAIGVSAGSAALSLGFGYAGWPLARTRAAGVQPTPSEDGAPPAPIRSVHSLRYLLAVAAGGATAIFTGPVHVHWTMAAAAVPLGAPDRGRRVRRGIHRILGTGAGLAIAAAILLARPGAAALTLIIIAMLFPTELFMRRHYALAMTFFTPAILLMTQLAAPADPLSVITDRGTDTLIGASIGVITAVAVPDPRSNTSA